MNEETLRLRRADGIAQVVLHRPESGNALDLPLASALRATIEDLTSDASTRVIVISAEGKLFCAGGDVAAMDAAADSMQYVTDLAKTLADTMLNLTRAEAIVVAAVNGAAAGAGLGLVLNADLVISSDRASYLSAYSGVGFVPDAGVSRRLPEIVGPRRALELTLTGRVLSAAEALEWGIVNEVVVPDELQQRVDEVASSIATGPAHALGATKRLITSRDTKYAAHLGDEVSGLREMLAHEDTRSRLTAFVERRRSRS